MSVLFLSATKSWMAGSVYAFNLLLLFQTGGSAELTALATSIQNIIIQLIIVGLPVALVLGAAMIAFGGMNPQWKQKGIETIKWAIIGGILAGLGVGAIQAFIVSSGGLGGGV